jgi:dethiobiotin synthetase
MNCYPRLVIAGTHSGVGKTTVTLAIMAALVSGIGSTAEFWPSNWMAGAACH